MKIVRTFDEADQQNFARWSGDENPIHMDSVWARRTTAGAPVVHGVHLVLWALEELIKGSPDGADLSAVRVDFRKFVFVGDAVTFEQDADRQGRWTLRLLTDHGLATVIRSRARTGEPFAGVPGATAVPLKTPAPACPSLDDMRSAQGWLVGGFLGEIEQAFPTLSNHLSIQTVSAVAQLSRLVGMICPGLHSIFAAFDLEFSKGSTGSPGIGFHTTAVDERFRLVRLQVAGSGLRGNVEAFVRPEPVTPISMMAAMRFVHAEKFAGRCALVVGGSRGLGAVTAKLLAAGGAQVKITYATGASEAREVVEDIAVHGGSCAAIRLDIREPVPAQLNDTATTHVYFFATPQIFLQKLPQFDRRVFDEFVDFYVGGFDRLCTHLAERSAGSIKLLYPSSIAVTERPPGLTEYAMAKAAGELLCEDLMRAFPQLSIDVVRLPRVLTDQTATVSPLESADAVQVLLPLLR